MQAKRSTEEAVTKEKVLDAIHQSNSKKAIELAKMYMKENPGQEAESITAQAYQLRIQHLQKAGLVQDAKNLIEVAKEKCPSYRSLFDSVKQETFHFPLSKDDVSIIAKKINVSSCDKQTQTQLMNVLKLGLANPAHLVECPDLPQDSSLKKEAGIVQNALKAVADDGSENERKEYLEQLSRIPRRSPLAPWCFFIRALDAYHHAKDSECKVLLARIPDNSILKPVQFLLESKIDKKVRPEGLSSRPTRELWKSLTPESPRSQWRDFIKSVESKQKKGIRDKIQTILNSKWLTSPIIIREFNRSVFNVMDSEDIFDKGVNTILLIHLTRFYGERAKMFFHLDSIISTGSLSPDFVAEDLEEFLSEWKHCLFPKEQAAVYARAAEFAQIEESSVFPFSFLFSPKPVNHSNSIRLYKRACQLDPNPDYFNPLISLMQKANKKSTELEKMLVKWQKTCPQDSTPLIYLYENAEKRSALQKAMKYLEEAEQVDRLNPSVRNARERLVWSLIQKHLQQKKCHLVERDLKQLDSLELTPLKRSLFDGVKRFVAIVQDKNDPGLEERHPLFDAILFRNLAFFSTLKSDNWLDKIEPLENLDTEEKLAIYYNMRYLFKGLNGELRIYKAWHNRIPQWIAAVEPISENLLIQISSDILQDEMPSIVIAATARGLRRKSSRLPEFLFYRALALWKESDYNEAIVMQCLRAVITLCRARGNYELERQALDRYKYFQGRFVNFLDDHDRTSNIELTEREIEQVIQREIKRTEPKTERQARKKTRKSSVKEMSSKSETSTKNSRNSKQRIEEEWPIEEDDDGLQGLLW